VHSSQVHERTELATQEHIHALGVIASLFNLLEFNFRQLFKLRLGLPPSLGYTLD
jgi:hypothetical protein